MLFLAWSNVSQHAMNCSFILFEILLTNAGPSPWSHIIPCFVLFACYLGVAYITHATQGFYSKFIFTRITAALTPTISLQFPWSIRARTVSCLHHRHGYWLLHSLHDREGCLYTAVPFGLAFPFGPLWTSAIWSYRRVGAHWCRTAEGVKWVWCLSIYSPLVYCYLHGLDWIGCW